MIWAACRKCGHELAEPGGLLFGPPNDETRNDADYVRKSHICRDCLALVEAFLDTGPQPAAGGESDG